MLLGIYIEVFHFALNLLEAVLNAVLLLLLSFCKPHLLEFGDVEREVAGAIEVAQHVQDSALFALATERDDVARDRIGASRP